MAFSIVVAIACHHYLMLLQSIRPLWIHILLGFFFLDFPIPISDINCLWLFFDTPNFVLSVNAFVFVFSFVSAMVLKFKCLEIEQRSNGKHKQMEKVRPQQNKEMKWNYFGRELIQDIRK